MDYAFAAAATALIISSILALEARELVYGAVALGLSFVSIAALFVTLGALYLAMFQVAVYIGAVVVLILFTVMLVGSERLPEETPERLIGVFVGAVIASMALFLVVVTKSLDVTPAESFDIPLFEIGRKLLTTYGVAFEVLALVLATAVIGSLTLAKLEKGET